MAMSVQDHYNVGVFFIEYHNFLSYSKSTIGSVCKVRKLPSMSIFYGIAYTILFIQPDPKQEIPQLLLCPSITMPHCRWCHRTTEELKIWGAATAIPFTCWCTVQELHQLLPYSNSTIFQLGLCSKNTKQINNIQHCLCSMIYML